MLSKRKCMRKGDIFWLKEGNVVLKYRWLLQNGKEKKKGQIMDTKS